MSIFENAVIKVTPAQLREKAQSVEIEVSNMQERLEDLENKLNGTASYWIGEAGDLHRELYKEQKSDVEIMIKRWSEHAKDLIEMADKYDNVEREVSNIATSLGITAGLDD